MSSKTGKVPSILLVGVGRFGEKHLLKLQSLEKKGLLRLLGAVVATEKSKKAVEERFGIESFTQISDDLLRKADAAVIVTPPETHFSIASRCLPFTNTFVEKPLATNSRDAETLKMLAHKHKRVLFVGHIFRFDSVVEKLKALIEPLHGEPVLIRGEFINPMDNDVGLNIPLELPHYFDIVSEILGKSNPPIIRTLERDRLSNVSIKYDENTHADFLLGWKAAAKNRFISFLFSDREITGDFLKQTVRINHFETGKAETLNCTGPDDPLTSELVRFLDVLAGKNVPYPDATAGVELVRTAERAKPSGNRVMHHKPKVAVIGAGIFGTNAAIEISKFADVTLFEENADIMQESSFVNQYRHHWGYHYPRSGETVKDIRSAIGDFEKLYDEAIIRNFPTFYCIAKEGSKTTSEEFEAFCLRHKLPFSLEYPDERYADRSKISSSLKTLEPIYDYKRLKKLVSSYLDESPDLHLKLGTEIIGGRLEEDGRKTLFARDSNGRQEPEAFDYVINATYAKYNQFAKWFGFPTKPVRIDYVESLIVKLPLPKISLAIMDGPFTNLVPMPEEQLFTLVHIKESILERYVPESGLPKPEKPNFSRVKETLEESAKWLPILKEAEVVEVRPVYRAVNAWREHDDARPSDISYLGFGCWSILGGKILSSVSTAKEIASEIKNDYYNPEEQLKMEKESYKQLDTPVLLVIFNRPETSNLCFEAIRKVKPKKLYIAADGPRPNRPDDVERCKLAREIVTKVDWPCELHTLLREENLGCRLGTTGGINWMLEHEEYGIIFDDDCIADPSFFYFCQELLEKYKDDERVMHICGTNFQAKNPDFKTDGSYYFSKISQNWGWATWRRAWTKHYKANMEGWPEYKKSERFKKWIPNGLFRDYWSYVFDRRYRKEIDDWDIPWTYSCMEREGLCIVPKLNLVTNIGSEPGGTHTFKPNIFTHVPKERMHFPLVHPKMKWNENADDYTNKTNYGVKTSPDRWVRLFIKTRFPSLFKKVKLFLK